MGACLAAVFSAAGFEVYGADQSQAAVDAVLTATPRFHEPGLAELLAEHPFHASTDTPAMCALADVAFIVTPTPSKEDGRFDASYVCAAAADVARGFLDRARPGTPIMVVVSTVMPGACDGEIRAAIEATGLTEYRVAFAPAFIALGSVIDDFRTADQHLIGCDDLATFGTLQHIYTRSHARGNVCRRLSIIDCEIAKLSVNAYLSVKIGFANTVARICEGQPGADVAEVLRAVGSDARIGQAYLHAGATASGPCLPRDVRAMDTVGGGAVSALVNVADDELTEWVAGFVERAADPERFWLWDVAILGLAYKADVAVADDSFGMRLAHRLRPLFEVVTHDPYITLSGVKRVTQVRTVDEAMDAAVVVVACDHLAYRGLKPRPGQTIVDVWRHCADVPGVVRPGIGP